MIEVQPGSWVNLNAIESIVYNDDPTRHNILDIAKIGLSSGKIVDVFISSTDHEWSTDHELTVLQGKLVKKLKIKINLLSS